MKIYDITRFPNMIELGHDGENNWRPNAFDCSSLLKNHPSGVLSLWLLPNGESQAFPVAVERDGNVIVWTPLSEEMTAEYGTLQIQCVDGSNVGKSDTAQYHVKDSIVPGAEHPSAVPSWATQVMERMQSAVEHYPTIIDSTWHVWDVDAGEWIDTGVPASVDEAVIANAVAAYLDEHPITVTETDPTVPAWAKQPNKPTYTAQEVGALPADTPIPAAVTEQTVSGWGFTKNTGDYSKPSGGIPKSDLAQTVQDSLDNADSAYQKPSTGIPKTDLASDVQTSLGKADTALQQHQSLSGYATEQWVGQQGYQTASDVQTAIAAAAELPSVSASDNGKSLVVENGAWGKGYQAARTPRVAMASTDTTPTLDPNKLYVFPEMATLTPTFATPTDSTIVNEYHFCFDSGSTATVLTLPASVLQPDGFTVEANMHYEISILEGAMTAQGWAVSSS